MGESNPPAAVPARRRVRQIIRVGTIVGGNETDLFWEPATGKLSIRYWHERRGAEVVVTKRFKKLTFPRVSEVVKTFDRLVDKGVDGEAIGLLKEMVGKMRGLIPAPREDDKSSGGRT